jgi:pimeloyl-ACP methyl ester carboxylesterase
MTMTSTTDPIAGRRFQRSAILALMIALILSAPAFAQQPGARGGTIASVDLGPKSPEALVFLHGWLMSTDLWSVQLAELCAERRCYAVAQPGHGVPRFDDPVTMTHWAEVLRTELHGAGIERAVLVGHSMGGMLAIEYVRRYPDEVLGLGLVGTTDTPGQPAAVAAIGQQLAGWNEQIAAGWAAFLIGAEFLEENPEWIGRFHDDVDGYDREWLPRLMGAIQGREDLTGFTPTINVPTVVIHSTTDGAVPFAAGEALAKRIPGAELVAIDGGGHAAPMETPEPVVDGIRRLMARVDSQ